MTDDQLAEAVVAMEYRASAEDISRMSHAHPTFTEAIKEAALAATDNRFLNEKFISKPTVTVVSKIRKIEIDNMAIIHKKQELLMSCFLSLGKEV